MTRLRIICLFFMLFSLDAYSKDLTNRLGVGMSDQFSEASMPSIAVRYYPSQQTGFSASLAVDTDEDQSKFGFMAKMYRIIFAEDNMNFYMGGGAALVSAEDISTGDNESGFELNGFAGGEFFFTGLDSLGFSFEAGVGVQSISSEVRFRTIADHPFRAGITFYF